MTSATSDGARLVGPVLRLGEVADAVLDAIREDNPDREVIVERHASYVRILCPEECIVRYKTVARMLGRAFAVSDIELNMSAFAGQIQTTDDQIRFFLHS